MQKGVKVKRINPKAISKGQLLGEFEPKSGLWQDGLLTEELKRYTRVQSSQKRWVHLDGPIDHEWAENLNSILDDNQSLTLPTGEIILIQNTCCLLFETHSLKNVTPATVSRCGLVHLPRG